MISKGCYKAIALQKYGFFRHQPKPRGFQQKSRESNSLFRLQQYIEVSAF
jgi:hypothetical protein